MFKTMHYIGIQTKYQSFPARVSPVMLQLAAANASCLQINIHFYVINCVLQMLPVYQVAFKNCCEIFQIEVVLR